MSDPHTNAPRTTNTGTTNTGNNPPPKGGSSKAIIGILVVVALALLVWLFVPFGTTDEVETMGVDDAAVGTVDDTIGDDAMAVDPIVEDDPAVVIDANPVESDITVEDPATDSAVIGDPADDAALAIDDAVDDAAGALDDAADATTGAIDDAATEIDETIELPADDAAVVEDDEGPVEIESTGGETTFETLPAE